MFSVLSRRRCARPVAAPRSVRPRLELLEDRNAPSTLTLTDQFATGANMTFGGAYNGATLANQVVTLTGHGWTTTATTDTNGNYHVTVPINASQFGTVTASVANPNCNQPQVTITLPKAPVITNFAAVSHPAGFWEISGNVTNTPNPSGLTINFSGMPALANQIATVEANGSFDVILQLNGEIGTAAATVTDWWGQAAPYVYCAVG
jgi:hypothetical protein